MKINQLAIAVAALAFSGAYVANAQAQTTGRGGTVTDSGRTSNRSGLADNDRGSFEANADTSGPVGRSAEDVRNMLRELRGPGQQQRSANMSVENLNERRKRRSSQRAQRSPPPPIHVQFRPSFGLHRSPALQMAHGMQTRLSRLLESRDAGVVQVVIRERTATLTGSVKSEYERSLLERMVRIEPGISAIENLITVESPPLAPAP